MCFPSKKTRANLEDQPQSQSQSATTPTPAPKSQPDSQPTPPTPTPTQPPTSTTTTANTEGTKMAPKVAIIIYSMYGHIAKSTLDMRVLRKIN